MKKVFETFKSNRKLLATLIGFLSFAVLSVIICIYIMPPLSSITQDGAREAFQKKIEGYGFGGVLIMFGIQVLQIVIAFIPGEPIEVLMGIMYGTFGGLVLSLTGCAVGTSIVFLAVKKFGQPLFEVFFDKKNIERFEFLKNSKKLKLLIFILFFIPGTPKDLLTYFAPLTPIKAADFLLLSVFARIPSIITSTYAGSSIIGGNLVKTVIIFAATAALGIAGIIISNKITDKEREK